MATNEAANTTPGQQQDRAGTACYCSGNPARPRVPGRATAFARLVQLPSPAVFRFCSPGPPDRLGMGKAMGDVVPSPRDQYPAEPDLILPRAHHGRRRPAHTAGPGRAQGVRRLRVGCRWAGAVRGALPPPQACRRAHCSRSHENVDPSPSISGAGLRCRIAASCSGVTCPGFLPCLRSKSAVTSCR